MSYKHLTFTDRLKIEAWQKARVKPVDMAKMLGVHYSTIYRELKRGQYERLNSDYTTEQRYSPDIAEKKYQDNLRAKGAPLKIGSDFKFAEYIEYMIGVKKYSPRAVLGHIKREGLSFVTSISAVTLYRYIEQGVFLTLTNDNLPVKRYKSVSRYKHVRFSRPPKGDSIEKRPIDVMERNSFGHWEMDCVIGKKGTKKTFLVLTERYSRYEIIRIMNDHTASSVVGVLDSIEREFGQVHFSKIFRSITCDNGSEFSDTHGIEYGYSKLKRVDLFYCHPYSSWERGSNENQNRMVRRFYPKGVSLNKVTNREAHELQEWINNYPRKIFDYSTSAEVFKACLSSLF